MMDMDYNLDSPGLLEEYTDNPDYNEDIDWSERSDITANEESDSRTPIVMCAIASAGLILNLVVIIMILVLGEYKKTSHWYVLQLAIADGIFLMMLPLAAIDELTNEWRFGSLLCCLYNGIFHVNYYASIFFITVMSFDRYVAIIFPMSPTWRKLRSRLGSAVVTLFVWILAIAASIPILAHTKLVEGNDRQSKATKCVVDFHDESMEEHKCIRRNIPLQNCSKTLSSLDDVAKNLFLDEHEPAEITGDDWMGDFSGDMIAMMRDSGKQMDEGYCYHEPYPEFVRWIYVNIAVAYIIPLTIVAFCYGCILWRVLHPRVKTAQSSLRREATGKTSFLRRRFSSSTSKKRNYRATVLVVSLVAAFLVCWTPFQVINALRITKLSENPSTCRIAVKVSLILAYISSLLNPLLYTFLGANFGKRVRRVFNKLRGSRADRPIIRRATKSNGRASLATRSTKSISESGNLPHINMQLLPPRNKHEPSMS